MAFHLPGDWALSHPPAFAPSLREPATRFRMPPGMRRFECHHIGNRELLQSSPQAAVLPIQGICDDCAKRPFLLHCLLDQLQSDLKFGTESRVLPPFGKIALRSVRLDLQRVIDLGICPQTGDRDHSVIDLAHTPQILPPDMGRLVTCFAISGLINDEHSLSVGSRRCLLAQELESLGLDGSFIPGGRRQETLAIVALGEAALLRTVRY